MGEYQTRLRELRSTTKLSQEATAEKVGISKVSYQRYENGERDIPGDVLLRMSDYFHVSTDYIMMMTDNPARSAETTTLAPDERELLDCYRQVEPWERELILNHAKMVVLHAGKDRR